jgi:hypothetical protein
MHGGHVRVFLSHTSELRAFPSGRSFVAAAEAAVVRARGVVTNMAYFAARDQAPSEYCWRLVQQADVYVGVIGFRYGTLVRRRSKVSSHTELEFAAASCASLPRLTFLLDERRELPLPAEHILDLDHGHRQAAFRRRLEDAEGVMVARVACPHELELQLYQALIELDEEHGVDARDGAHPGSTVYVGSVPQTRRPLT